MKLPRTCQVQRQRPAHSVIDGYTGRNPVMPDAVEDAWKQYEANPSAETAAAYREIQFGRTLERVPLAGGCRDATAVSG